MMKFVSAWINANGDVIGCSVGDMPIETNIVQGATCVSVAAVVSASEREHLVKHLKPLLVKNGDEVRLEAAARDHCDGVLHGPASVADVKGAAALNPVVAEWLRRKLPKDHGWGTHIETSAEAHPPVREFVDSLMRRSADPQSATGFQQFARRTP